MKRQYRETELGTEAQCSKCKGFWPADAEFYFMGKDGRPHSWCKACYIGDRVAKGQRPGYGNGSMHHDHARAAA